MATPLKLLLALFALAAPLSACVTPEQISRMPDQQVCDSALAWPGGGQPNYANDGYGGMFASEAVGRGLSVSTCANLLLASLGGASDQYICDRAVSWSDLDQAPYWSNYAGIYRYIAGSRGFVPIDCHDSNFECLDHGFIRGSDTFKQCRLQLIVARREDVRIRLAVEAAAAHQQLHLRREHRHRDLAERGHKQRSQTAQPLNENAHGSRRGDRHVQLRGDLSLSNPYGEGPLEKKVRKFHTGSKTVSKTTSHKKQQKVKSAPSVTHAFPPTPLQAAAEAYLKARKQTP